MTRDPVILVCLFLLGVMLFGLVAEIRVDQAVDELERLRMPAAVRILDP